MYCVAGNAAADPARRKRGRPTKRPAPGSAAREPDRHVRGHATGSAGDAAPDPAGAAPSQPGDATPSARQPLLSKRKRLNTDLVLGAGAVNTPAEQHRSRAGRQTPGSLAATPAAGAAAAYAEADPETDAAEKLSVDDSNGMADVAAPSGNGGARRAGVSRAVPAQKKGRNKVGSMALRLARRAAAAARWWGGAASRPKGRIEECC